MVNDTINTCVFPTKLKEAEVIPIHKKEETTNKANYRPISILPTFSKIYERVLFQQITSYMDSKFSANLCGFRKGMSTQHCLITMIETLKKTLDKGGATGILLTDLSKAFDCLPHDLLIAKLDAYGFDVEALKLIHSYLTGRKQRTKINKTFSSWSDILYGVPQGSILSPLLFNIFINDMFLSTNNDIANYADDNSPFAYDYSNALVIEKLENTADILIQWYKDNYMKLNENKSKLLLSHSESENKSIKIGNETILNTKSEKLLGITVDNKLTFKDHVSNLCKKANQKLNALARITRYMDTDKLKVTMKAFIASQFNYCPLVWMFYGRKLNNRINKIQERSLKLIYKDRESTFSQLLLRDNSFTVHERNLQVLATEIFKFKNNMSPTIMNRVFSATTHTYNLRNDTKLRTFNVKTVKCGTETIRFRGPKIWELVPEAIKFSQSLEEFKIKIKQWKPIGCTCKLCKQYIPNLGYL